jgi:transcription elongation factor S-II
MPLDAKQVEQKGRELTKAADSSTADASTILRFLTELRTGVVASEGLLRSTKIGVTVNKLRQHSNSQIKSAAAELVNKWKLDVKRATGSGANTPRGATTTTTVVVGKEKNKEAAAKRPDVPKEKRNVKTDGVNYKVTGNDVRDSCVKLMYDGLAYMSEDGTFSSSFHVN